MADAHTSRRESDAVLSTWTAPPNPASLAISCADVDDAFEQLTVRGVKPSSGPEDAAWGRWLGLQDPNCNTWLVVEATES